VDSCACTRCCHPRRSSINAQYNMPSVRISTTCGEGIHESGNRPSHNNVRNSRASARSVLAPKGPTGKILRREIVVPEVENIR
jgi:hypothetical protein